MEKEEQKGKANNKKVTISINGTETEWDKGEITFDEVVAFAFPEESQDPLVIFKVTYERDHGNKDGILEKSHPVKVKEGTSFDATNSGRS